MSLQAPERDRTDVARVVTACTGKAKQVREAALAESCEKDHGAFPKYRLDIACPGSASDTFGS